MLMLCKNERVDRLAMANPMNWYGSVNSGDGHVLRRSIDLEVDGHWKEGRLKSTWKKQVEEEFHKCWFEQGRCSLLTKEDRWH